MGLRMEGWDASGNLQCVTAPGGPPPPPPPAPPAAEDPLQEEEEEGRPSAGNAAGGKPLPQQEEEGRRGRRPADTSLTVSGGSGVGAESSCAAAAGTAAQTFTQKLGSFSNQTPAAATQAHGALHGDALNSTGASGPYKAAAAAAVFDNICSRGVGAIGGIGGVLGNIGPGRFDTSEGIVFGKRIPGSSHVDADVSSGVPVCPHHPGKRGSGASAAPPIEFDDEFEEYRARANSGGSLYGLLRRQERFCEEDDDAASHGSPETYRGRPRRQRSKSLVPDNTLKLFPGGRRRPTSPCECMDHKARASPKPPRHPRRFSAACVDARDVVSKHVITVSISPPPGSPDSTDESWIAEADEDLEAPEEIPEIPDSLPQCSCTSPAGPGASPRGTPCSSPRGSPAHGTPSPPGGGPSSPAALAPFPADDATSSAALDLLKPPDLLGRTVDDIRQTVYRRRSFCITSKGIINEGDFFVDKLANTVIDASSVGSDLDADFGGGGGGGGGDHSRASSIHSQCSGAVLSGASSGDTSCHRVLVLGAAGVGKTSLTQQFCTSEYMGAQNTSFGESHHLSGYYAWSVVVYVPM